MMLLTSFMFVNAVNLPSPDPEFLGLTVQEMIEAQKAQFNYSENPPQKVIMITILAMSNCGLSTIVIKSIFYPTNAKRNHFGVYSICNGMLSGVISVAAAATGIEIWSGIIIALFASLLYQIGSRLLIKFEIDDPLEASLVFGLQGFWGIIAAGIFDRNKGWLYTGSLN